MAVLPRSRAACLAGAVATLAAALPTAASAATLATLTARAHAASVAHRRAEAQLARERAQLAGTRLQLDAAEQAFAARQAILVQRLRQLYAQPTPDVMIAALAMDPEEVRARMDLAESAAAADASILGDVRAALVGLRVAEDAMRRRKQELAGRTRFLAARDAMAAAGLARARDAQPPTATPQPVTGTTKPGVSRGLPAGVVRDHTLPGAAPVDRATGRPISFAAPAANTVVVPAVGTPSRMVLRTGWYSPAGRITTSGDVFTPDGLTAAHRTLPLGTRLRLFYGSREVVVRINDRGPFVPGQDLDVSPAAAGALGLNRVTTLRAEVVR